MTLAAPTGPTDGTVPLVLSLALLNQGYGHGIVEWLALRVTGLNGVMLYTPIAEVDYPKFVQGLRKLHAENILFGFDPFVLGSREAAKRYILFTQQPNNPKYPLRRWRPGTYHFELHGKTSRAPKARVVSTFERDISAKTLEDFERGNSIVLMDEAGIDI